MAAPKGNRFWELRSKHGRDTLFASPELLWESACEYFEYIESNPFEEDVVFHSNGVVTHDTANKKRPFTLMGLCLFLGCNTKYFNDFEEVLNKRSDTLSLGFSEIVTRIREVIYNQKFEGAVTGFFNANLIARELGIKDTTVNEMTGKDGKDLTPIQISIDGKNITLE